MLLVSVMLEILGLDEDETALLALVADLAQDVEGQVVDEGLGDVGVVALRREQAERLQVERAQQLVCAVVTILNNKGMEIKCKFLIN